MKKTAFVIALIFAIGAATVLAVLFGLFDKWEMDAYDVLCRAGTKSNPQSDRISIIMIDESTLAWCRHYYLASHAGRDAPDREKPDPAHIFNWPWDRSVYDLIIQFLAMGGAKVLALDMDFSSPYPSGDESGDHTLGLTTFMQNTYGDPYVIHTLNFETAAVPGVETVTLSNLEKACLAGSAVAIGGWKKSGLPFGRSDFGTYCNPILPYRAILEQFRGKEKDLRLGAVCTQPDFDSLFRRARPFVCYRDLCYPSLGLAAALAYIEGTDGKGTYRLGITGRRLLFEETKRAKKICIPLTRSGDILIRWRDDGREDPTSLDAGHFRTYPAHRVLRSYLDSAGLLKERISDKERLDPKAFKDRIVFLGANAAALHDLKGTPISEDYPGVKIHAAVAETFLDGRAISHPAPWIRALAAAAAAIAALLVTLLVPSHLLKFTGILVLAFLYAAGAAVLFLQASTWLNVVTPLLGVFLAYSGGTTFNYFTEGRRSREISGLFQHFAPPDVVSQLIADPARLTTKGEIRDITSFFSDIQGFTSLSNTPMMRKDPGLLTEHLNSYLTEMTHSITDCGGTLDKYIGDAVVAIFGAPLAIETHAREACRAALACQRRLEAFNAAAETQGLPPLVTRIGLYSGDATVGCVGSLDRFNYSAIGSTVNFASRLEGVNKSYGTLVLAGGPTARGAGEGIFFRFLDRVRVPGVAGDAPPLEIFQVLAEKGEKSPLPADLLDKFAQARDFYGSRRFEEAAALFDKLRKKYGDKPSNVFYERCLIYVRTPPPPEWDGAFKIATK